MSGLKRGSVAVIGVAESDLGQVAPHTSPLDLMAQATRRALDDCGLSLQEVDAVFSSAAQVRQGPMALAEYLRIKPKYFDGTQIGGSSFMAHVAHGLRLRTNVMASHGFGHLFCMVRKHTRIKPAFTIAPLAPAPACLSPQGP